MATARQRAQYNRNLSRNLANMGAAPRAGGLVRGRANMFMRPGSNRRTRAIARTRAGLT